MQTYFRLTLLGTFASMGIAVAIALALQFEKPQSNSRSPVGDESRQETPSSDNSPAEEPKREPAVGSNPLRSATAPQVAPYHPPVANQVEELEATFNRANNAARQNEQLLNDALTTLRQPPSGSPRILSVQRGPPAEAPAAENEPAETLPPPARNPGGPTLAEVRKNEGDDTLTLNVQNADLREVFKLISDQWDLNILASKSVQGSVSATITNVDLNTALNAVLQSTGYTSRREGRFVYVGTPQDFIEMDQLKDKLGTRIYRTNYVRASDLQVLITPLLTERVGKVTISLPSEVDIAASTTKTGGNGFANEEVIMVRDYEAVLLQIDQIVEEVDRRPQQVLIEAMILTVKLDDTLTMGVDLAGLLNTNNARLFTGSPLATLGGIDVTKGGLKFGFLNGSVRDFVTALETVGDTNVVASPKLMCLNKQRAEILIGQQLGYISSTVTETSTTQAVQFLEVGTQLRIRPYISRDCMVRMEVHPELSTGNVRVVGAFTLPDKTVTQVTTNIMCRDGATVVIGGLMREDLGANVNQVPLLGNLPWVGALFRRKVETTSKNEIIVVLTPRIVTEPEVNMAGVQAAGDYLQRQSVFADKMSPIGKRHYGRTHYRLALAAWQAGNAQAALRNINISIQFDPLSLDAIRLRNEITGTGNWVVGDVPPDDSFTPEFAPPNRTLELPPPQGKTPRTPVKQAQFKPPIVEGRKKNTSAGGKP